MLDIASKMTRLSCGVFPLLRAGFLITAVLSILGNVCLADLAQVQCDTPTSKGAMVDSQKRCAFFAHYAPDGGKPDDRIARNLQLTTGQSARSIAVIVGISNYDNKDYSIPAAHVDVVKLTSFLVDRQQFDEVIVLEDKNATMDNIRYFLRKYALDRTNFYQGKVRFLFAYSGHGVQMQFFGDNSQPASRFPSVGLALAAAADDGDYGNIYGLNELRALFNDLANNTYHFLALINACFGGNVFGVGLPGGSYDDMTGRGAVAITAGPDDKEVYSTADGQGSLFFDAIINGVDTGDADLEAQKSTLKMPGSLSDYDGIVRLGELDGYLLTTILKTIKGDQGSAASLQGNLHHWIGPVEPSNVHIDGGFFFFQSPSQAATKGFQHNLQFGAVFAPSANQIAASPASPQDDGLQSLRSKAQPVRGVDVSRFNGQIDWAKVAAQNISFAYIKATQSSNLVDTGFSANWQNAQEVGLARGAYHTFSFCTKPQDQFANLKRTVALDPSALPVVVDIELFENQAGSNISSLSTEGKCAATLGASGVQTNLSALLKLVGDAYGKKPIIYGNDYVLNAVLTPAFTNGIPLWRVKYGLASQSPPSPWAIWQYTGNEKIAGINGPVDVDVLSSSQR